MRAMQPAVPRYSSRPFPVYRFVPGEHPHPTAHPEGHSYLPPGAAHPAAEFFPPERWRESGEYLFGCDLYNHGYWWEAHESWEALWQLTDKSGVQGRFLQGLIQVGACHLKLRVGHLRGVRDLLGKFRPHLAFVLERIGDEAYMGLRVRPWVEHVERYYEERLAAAAPQHEWAEYPYVPLEE